MAGSFRLNRGYIIVVRSASSSRILFFFLLLLLAGGCYLVFLPGLSGSFLFDDYPNLEALGASGGISDWDSLKRYLLSGFSGPTGRPISLASFLIDANNWPADPYIFKQTNVLLHLFNGVLLYFLISSLLTVYWQKDESDRVVMVVAGFCSIAWLLHPFLVSTTLYVVQRMAMLPLTFTLIGLIAWIAVRKRSTTVDPATYIKLTFILGISTVLATFSKENGALIPVFVLILEFSILSKFFPRLNPLWRGAFLIFPVVLIVSYLVYIAVRNGIFVMYGGREFSPYERLLTQFRVVWEYLYNWFIPRLNTTGIYHDTVLLSKGWFEPPTTLIAMFATVVSLLFAIIYHKRWPFASLAILFFFSSQLIESTVIGLELKFEHRAYLGSIFLFLPLAGFLARRFELRKVAVLFCCVVLLLGVFTHYRAKLWGDFPTMIMVWAEKNPYSPRAQVELGKLYYGADMRVDSLRILEAAQERIPDDLTLSLTTLMVKCKVSEVSDEEKLRVEGLAQRSLYKATNFTVMQNLLEWTNDPECKGLSDEFLVRFTEALLRFPRNQEKSSLAFSQISYIQGIALLRLGSERAFPVLRESLQARSEPQKLMNIAAYMATYRHVAEAKGLAEQAKAAVLEEGRYGRELAESPELSDIEAFLSALERDSRSESE